jgi:hypothetical protein
VLVVIQNLVKGYRKIDIGSSDEPDIVELRELHSESFVLFCFQTLQIPLITK